MNYKKIIKNQKTRFAILKALRWVPDKTMCGIQYWIKLGRICNFSNPKRWTEKLQLYKIKYRNPIMSNCVDKYEVRRFVERRGCGRNLVKLYGLWSNPNKIDFDKLPNQFVLKTTNGGGGLDVVLVRDKTSLNQKETIDFLASKMNKGVNSGREWAYTGIKKSRIICEELLVNSENQEAGIDDFKILCFSGEPKFIWVDNGRFTEHRRNFFNTDWQRVNVTSDTPQFDTEYPKPRNFDEMMEVARKLSEGFPFVRVDLYNIDGKIYFGELTFYPWAGYIQFTPDSFDFELGALMSDMEFTNESNVLNN